MDNRIKAMDLHGIKSGCCHLGGGKLHRLFFRMPIAGLGKRLGQRMLGKWLATKGSGQESSRQRTPVNRWRGRQNAG